MSCSYDPEETMQVRCQGSSADKPHFFMARRRALETNEMLLCAECKERHDRNQVGSHYPKPARLT